MGVELSSPIKNERRNMSDEQVALQSMRLQMHCVQCDMRYSYSNRFLQNDLWSQVSSQIQQFILLGIKLTHTELTSLRICGHVHRHKHRNEEGQGRFAEEGTKHAECCISKSHTHTHTNWYTEHKRQKINPT